MHVKLCWCVAVRAAKQQLTLWVTTWLGTVVAMLPPASAARSTVTEPGFMDSIMSRVISSGAFLPGMRAVVMMMSTSLACCLNSAICIPGTLLSLLWLTSAGSVQPPERLSYGLHLVRNESSYRIGGCARLAVITWPHADDRHKVQAGWCCQGCAT